MSMGMSVQICILLYIVYLVKTESIQLTFSLHHFIIIQQNIECVCVCECECMYLCILSLNLNSVQTNQVFESTNEAHLYRQT